MLGLAGLLFWSLGEAFQRGIRPWDAESEVEQGDLLLEALLEADQSAPGPLTKDKEGSKPQATRQPNGEHSVSSPEVRIALFSHFPVKSLEAKGRVQCLNSNGKEVNWERLIRLTQTEFWHCRAGEGGSIAVNGDPYLGSIQLIRQDMGWLAINRLPLETYVASVVGAEMPSHWKPEALKAQAVAARSYALVHIVRPASTQYNLGDTTRWQVYRGLSSSTESTIQATQATRNQVLKFRGGLVESLYASTNKISEEAHGHLGASMSQTGAQELSGRGYTYDEILNRYYNGAELARIKLNGD